MDLVTKAILIVPIDDDAKNAAFEEAIARLTVVRSCANCYKAIWSDDKTTVTCGSMGVPPPAWAIAMGCSNFDYLPF